MVRELDQPHEDMAALFETVIEHIPAPDVKPDGPFEMLVSNLDWSDYVGRIGIGKISGGQVSLGDNITRIAADGMSGEKHLVRVNRESPAGILQTV